jgi:hypothetical protein
LANPPRPLRLPPVPVAGQPPVPQREPVEQRAFRFAGRSACILPRGLWRAPYESQTT